MEPVRKTFWIFTLAVAMFLDLTILLPIWALVRFNSHVAVVMAMFLAFIIAPLTAWLTIERLILDSSGNYYGWELDRFTDWGKKAIAWGNPAGWLILGIIWCLVKAGKRWPSIGLFFACFL